MKKNLLYENKQGWERYKRHRKKLYKRLEKKSYQKIIFTGLTYFTTGGFAINEGGHLIGLHVSWFQERYWLYIYIHFKNFRHGIMLRKRHVRKEQRELQTRIKNLQDVNDLTDNMLKERIG